MIDAPDEAERAAAAGVRRVLVRLTPGVEAVTHHAIRTAHEESKFGLSPEAAVQAISRARQVGLDVAGVHMHVGSQLVRPDESVVAVERLLVFLAEMRDRWHWTPQTIDLGGGLGVRHHRDEHPPSVAEFVGPIVRAVREGWPEPVQIVLEPGRSLVGRAGVTLYRVGVVKESGGGVVYAAIDGGMSDNPRPQLYGARYEALLAERADELADRRLPGRRQALRVGRRADRGGRAGAARAGRPARGAGNGRVHALARLDLQRRAAAGGRARLGRRGPHDPPPRDGRGAAAAGDGDVSDHELLVWSDYI